MGKVNRGMVLVGVVALAVLGLASAASAANRVGTVTIGNTGTSSRGDTEGAFGQIAASSSGVVFEQTTPGGRSPGWYGLPAGSGTPVALTGLPAGDSAAGSLLAGSLAVVTDFGGQVAWEAIDGSSSSGGQVAAVPTGYTATLGTVAVAPGGWLTFGYPTGSPPPSGDNELLLVSTTGTVTNLGDVTDSLSEFTGGPNGVLLSDTSPDATSAEYISYAAPHTPVALSVPSSVTVFGAFCPIVTAANGICVGNAQVARVPLDGASTTTLDTSGLATSGTDADGAWINDNQDLVYQPWSGGAATTVTSGVGLPVAGLGTDGTSFYLGGGGPVGGAGIGKVTPPGTSSTTVVTAATAPIEGFAVSVSPGRATWTDDAPAPGLTSGASAVWSRSLTNGGSSLSAGSASLISSDASGYSQVGASGNRTLYLDASQDLQLQTGTGGSPVKISAPVLSGSGFECFPTGTLSGARLLWFKPTCTEAAGTEEVYNTLTGTNTALKSVPTASSTMTLWGDYVAWSDTNGSVWRLDLATPAAVPAEVYAPAGESNCGGNAYAAGAYVAWNENCFTTSSVQLVGYRNMTTGASPVNLTSVGQPVALSTSYLAVVPTGSFVSPTSPQALSAVDLATGTATPVGEASGPVSLDGSTIAWIDQDGVPQAAPLPSLPDPPQFLGDPLAPSSYTVGHGTWNAEFDTSAVLTTCSVTIASGPSTVADLPSAAADMAVADADVSWSGRTTSGSNARPGTYTWTVHASNGSGPLESGAGTALVLSGSVTIPGTASPAPSPCPVRGSPSAGYDLAGANGAIYPFGDLASCGSLSGLTLNRPIVGLATTSDGGGYWMVGSDGGVFNFGDARFHGSTGGVHLNQPIVGMAEDPATGGYWLVAADGGVFNFDAPFRGSLGNVHLNQPIVGIVATPTGKGYWLVARDGGVFEFGDAAFHGSTGGIHLNQPIVGMAADLVSGGYWLVASDGGVFNFDAPFRGSTGNVHLNQPVVGMVAGPAETGYWLVARDGGIFNFGVPIYGSLGGQELPAPIIGAAGR